MSDTLTERSSRGGGGIQVGLEIRLRGVPEVLRALGQLSGPTMNRVLQKASTAGAKALKPFIKAEAPIGPSGNTYTKRGALKRSISARKAKRDLPAAVVSARPKVAFYRHMVIGGTKPHRIRFPNQKAAGVPRDQGNIRHPGAKANPFVARGFAKGESAALAAIDRTIDDYLETL